MENTRAQPEAERPPCTILLFAFLHSSPLRSWNRHRGFFLDLFLILIWGEVTLTTTNGKQVGIYFILKGDGTVPCFYFIPQSGFFCPHVPTDCGDSFSLSSIWSLLGDSLDILSLSKFQWWPLWVGGDHLAKSHLAGWACLATRCSLLSIPLHQTAPGLTRDPVKW